MRDKHLTETQWLAAIVLAAVTLRLAVAVVMGNTVDNIDAIYDQRSYDMLAQRVVEGYGFNFGVDWWPLTRAGQPTAHWSFLYVSYLAGVYALFGHLPVVARILQAAAAGVIIPWLVYYLGKRAFGAPAGLAAAAISAVYIYFIFYAAALMTETFFTLGWLWVLVQATGLRAQPHPALRHWTLLGLAMAFTVLLRQVFLPLAGLVLAWLVITQPAPRRRALRGAALAAAVVVAAILPWTLRNYRVFGQFVLLNTNGGYVFFWANHPVHGTNFMTLLPEDIPYTSLIPEELRGLDEAALEKALMRRALDEIAAHPGRYILLSINRIKDQFKFWPTRESGLISNLSRVGSFGIFLPFGVVGVVMAVRRSWRAAAAQGASFWARAPAWCATDVSLWLACYLLYTAVHLASWAAVRYRLPSDILLIVFAGLPAGQILQTLSAHRRAPAQSPARGGVP